MVSVVTENERRLGMEDSISIKRLYDGQGFPSGRDQGKRHEVVGNGGVECDWGGREP